MGNSSSALLPVGHHNGNEFFNSESAELKLKHGAVVYSQGGETNRTFSPKDSEEILTCGREDWHITSTSFPRQMRCGRTVRYQPLGLPECTLVSLDILIYLLGEQE